MIIGAGILQAPAIKIAREMGLYTVVTDYNPRAYGMRFADYPIVMSTRDVDGTVRVAKDFAAKKRIDGVITVGTDASLTVAAVQHALDLPGNRIDVAEATTHKVKMRKRLFEHGVPEPNFYSCWSYEELLRAAEHLGYPLVVKPVDNMGARGVMKVKGPEVLRFAYERAKNASPRGEIIAEEFMDGLELSIDALVWQGKVYITGVADRIIEFPPYFVETGHIMPTDLPQKQVEDAINVFNKGIKALGIEVGAAKGDIKVTSEGAKVGEIASRLSGGFMSAYTYPYSSGVNLIKAGINIALGEPPGDLEQRYNRVSVERAIIPGSGIVKKIEGIEEALSIEGVRNVFVTCNVGEVVHIPTSNVEKCGNVIAVGETREEALASANLGVKTIRIILGEDGELNHGLIRKNALQKLSGTCSVCRVCDGVECSGWIPGIGSRQEGKGFKRNLLALRNYVVVPDFLKTIDNINTGSNLFGIPLDIPVVLSPISNLKINLKGIFDEKEYNTHILRAAKKSGVTGCLAQMEGVDDCADTDYILDPLQEVNGNGIPFFNPSLGENTTLNNIEKAVKAGAKVVGISLDGRNIRGAVLMDSKRLTRLVKKVHVPLIVKGILSVENALSVVEAGARGIMVSNRGGRILESLPSGAEVVSRLRKAVGQDILIILDGGIRSGEDVFKAIALGADLVGIGRPVLIYFAGGGENGVVYYLNSIKEELFRVMLVAGAKTTMDIKPQMIEKMVI